MPLRMSSLKPEMKLCRLFNFDKLKNVISPRSITYSLNYIIKGYLRPGDHVLVSALEHNAHDAAAEPDGRSGRHL